MLFEMVCGSPLKFIEVTVSGLICINLECADQKRHNSRPRPKMGFSLDLKSKVLKIVILVKFT